MKKTFLTLYLQLALFIPLYFVTACTSNQQTSNQQSTGQQNLPANHTPILPIRSPEDRENYEASRLRKTEKRLQTMQTQALSIEEVEQFCKEYYLPTVFSGYESMQDESDSPFYGITNWNHVRIEWHISEVKQDPVLPRKFYISGKRRLDDQIVPFEGSFSIDSMYKVSDENIDEAMLEQEGFKALYTAKGNFSCDEPSEGEENGSNWGTLTIDLAVRRQAYPYEENELDTWQILYKPGTYPEGLGFVGICKGAGFQIKGLFTYYHIKRSREILIAENLFMIMDDFLPDFMSGNPNPRINSKYHVLGWDESVLEGSDNWWEEAEGSE
ncbi:hypothetical protein GXP67_00255 [Rhodocytophaga rosea]|uniref:Uncharacterized protein n=1 Tax=Rhodocytophaga rosea TaxID=2704465 RepID=A0A6C0GB94_9BACT|nr:hypothetical protein [Rhodocytophaga rosea]QHT65215.1 hypothetical protein GXP67_00255 [Rhodocytophaga rosea]